MFGSFGAPRRLLWFFLGALSIVAVAGVAMGAPATSHVAASTAAAKTVSDIPAASAAQGVSAQFMGTVDMANVPQETAGQAAAKTQAMPYLHAQGAAAYAAMKAAANQGANAVSPAVLSAIPTGSAPVTSGKADLATPSTRLNFPGMADSGTICKFFGGGCQPSDMALGADSAGELQAVNTSIAAYSTTGALKPGFPKDAQAFFGVPNPSPAGCNSGENGAFLSDPRISYDMNDHRFFITYLEVEGYFGLNSCTPVSKIWIGVSTSSNPAGSYFIYQIDPRLGNPNIALDFDQLGYNQQGLFFSGDMFNAAGTALVSNVVISLAKAPMESGGGTSGFAFTGLTANGQILQDIQPIQSENRTGGPSTEYFLNSFAGGGNSVVLWSFANPIGQQSAGPHLTGVIIGTASYSVPPNADNAGACTNCVDTNDSRISSQPVYRNGRIYAALPTGINNGTTTVSGIYWFILRPALDQGAGSCTLCVSLTGSSRLEEHNYYFYGGRQFAYYPSMGVDDEGNFELLFNFSSNTFAPSVAYALHRVTNNPGLIPGSGIFLRASTTPTFDSRWGDYSAATYRSDNNTIWMAGQFSGANSDWATQIGEVATSITSTLGAQG